MFPVTVMSGFRHDLKKSLYDLWIGIVLVAIAAEKLNELVRHSKLCIYINNKGFK